MSGRRLSPRARSFPAVLRTAGWIGCLLACALLAPGAGCAPAADSGPRQTGGEDEAAGVASPSTGCVGVGGEPEAELQEARGEILGWIGERRAEEGLASVAPETALCRVAQRRSEDVARAGRIDSSGTIGRVSRRLGEAGYEAHRWTERSLLGYRTPVRMVVAWSRSGQPSFESTVLGDYEQVGVGVADEGEGTAVVLLFATPRSSWFAERIAGLEDLAAVRREALERVNRARDEAGVDPVVSDPKLDAAAQAHADDMRDRGYYSHVSPQGVAPKSWARRAGYAEPSFLAENIAKGLFEPAEAVERWLGSRDHRRNILDDRATETGLGIAWGEVDGQYQVFWVQLFADPAR